MNMGIEQYIYETLEKPWIEIAAPVSYGLNTHDRIDWINTDNAQEVVSAEKNRKLVLLGGCDMLQLASYCSNDRIEFVNGAKQGMKIRYDDPSFVLNDRELIRTCKTLREFPWWTYEDAVRFDEAVARANLILLSMWPGMNGDYCRLPNGVRLRCDKPVWKILESEPEAWVEDNFEILQLDDSERLELTVAAFDAIAARSQSNCNIFVLGCYTRGIRKQRRLGEPNPRLGRREGYNTACRSYCEEHSARFHFVDVDLIISPEHLVDRTHFSRHGYYMLAEHILAKIGKQEYEPTPGSAVTTSNTRKVASALEVSA